MVWTSLHHRGLRCTCTCLHYLSGQQETVMVWTSLIPQGPKLDLDLCRQQEPLLLLDVSKLQGPKLQEGGGGWSQIQ
jgi:hypothetical protein